MKFNHTFTHYLLLPMLDIPYPIHLNCGIDEAYLGCPEYTGNEEMGEYMFVTYKSWKHGSEEAKALIKEKSIDTFTNSTNGLLTKVFEIPEEYKIDVEYFKRGDYSKISKEYVDKYFPITVTMEGEEVKHNNRMVFDKDRELADIWDIQYNVQIPEDAEVYPKPDPDRELLKPKGVSNDTEFVPTIDLTSA